MKCGNCVYYDAKSGVCRFDSPRLFQEQGTGNYSEVVYHYCSYWPSVAEEDWCGKFESKERGGDENA